MGTHQSNTLMGPLLIRTDSTFVRTTQLDNHICNCRSTCVDRQPRHRFLEPIHNVKDGADAPTAANRGSGFFIPGKFCRHYVAGATVVVEPVGIEPTTSSLQS